MLFGCVSLQSTMCDVKRGMCPAKVCVIPLRVSDQSVFRRKSCFSVSCPYMWTHCTRQNYLNIPGEFCQFCC